MLRADALATLYFFHPLRKLRPQSNRIPILMYHSVSDAVQEGIHPYYRTVTTPAVFERQIRYLREHGYKSISPAEAAQLMDSDRRISGRPVAITFDDGFRDFYTNAFPVLQKYGFNAIVYLPTAYIGAAPKQFNGVECLTWNQVRELKAAGTEFGSHTVTHPHLRSVDNAQVHHEVRASKVMIEQELGAEVNSFSYPYAFPEMDRTFTRNLRHMLEEEGYENGVSTIIGTADTAGDRYFMRRLPVNSCDDERLFRAKLDGSYDWLHAVQRAAKAIPNKNR